jgi:hypothetical protein
MSGLGDNRRDGAEVGRGGVEPPAHGFSICERTTDFPSKIGISSVISGKTPQAEEHFDVNVISSRQAMRAATRAERESLLTEQNTAPARRASSAVASGMDFRAILQSIGDGRLAAT